VCVCVCVCVYDIYTGESLRQFILNAQDDVDGGIADRRVCVCVCARARARVD
jgi:hypothetical protein